MAPGPDLDAEVARKVLGVVVIMDTGTNLYQLRDVANNRMIALPHYSTDTTAAHELIKMFKAKGCTFSITAGEQGTWQVTISHNQVPITVDGSGSSLAHGICNAVLLFNQLFKFSR
jgi:hypothetical protein